MAKNEKFCDKKQREYVEEWIKIFNELDDKHHKAIMTRNDPKDLTHYDGFLKLIDNENND